MKRLVGTAIGLGVIALLLCIPAFFYGSGTVTPTFEDTTITNYVANFDVASNGDMDVTETITVDFPGYGKHGIFRFWDLVDDNSPHARRTPEDITVTRDGSDEPFELSWRGPPPPAGGQDRQRQHHARRRRAHLRDQVPHRRRARQNNERITGEDVDTMFYWQLIPRGWQQTIEKSTLTVHLPVPAQADVKCAIGNDSETGCTAEGGGTTDLTVTTGPIADRTPVTIATGLDMETPPEGNSVPWTGRWDRVLEHPPAAAHPRAARRGGSACLRLDPGRQVAGEAAGLPGPLRTARGDRPGAGEVHLQRDRRPHDVRRHPHARRRKGGDRPHPRQNDSWTITDKAGPAGWAGLDPVTTDIAHILGGPGPSFTAQKKDVSAGLRLKEEVERFDSSVETWSKTSGNMVSSGLGGLGGLLVLVAFGLMLVGIIWNPFSMTALALIPGAFAVGGLSLMATGSGTSRTRAGRDLWSRVGGFRRMLATPSSKQRFDFSGRKELYTAYIPWAVALDCADEWAAKYRVEVGEEPPVPHYFAGAYAGTNAGAFVNSMVGDFDSTVSGAISSYNATQSSSSSGGGGGGFSGGGGGGGGGGGSW